MKLLHLEPVEHPEKMSTYWKREWKLVSLITLFGILCNGLISFGPILQGRLIDTLAAGSPLNLIIRQALLYIGMILIIQIFRFWKRYTVRLFANRTCAAMRLMIYNNIINRSITELSKESAGDLMSKAVSDVDISVEGMRKITTEVFDTGVLMLSYIAAMFSYSWKITSVTIVFIPLAMWLAEKMKTVITRYSKSAREQYSRVSQLTYDGVEHALLFRVNGIEGKNRKKYAGELDDLQEKTIRASVLENSMQPVYKVIAMTGIILVFSLGGRNVIDRVWTIGMFSAYMILFGNMATKASKAAKLFNSYQKAKVSWLRIKPWFAPYQRKNTLDRGLAPRHTLHVRNLSFAYPEEEHLVVEKIHFSLRPGEICGITGPIACGKSSLGISLQGLFPYQGSIELDGVELRDYSEMERSNRISYLGHQAELLSDTIYQNITLGDDGDILPVLRDVCFEEDLRSMPDGIQTLIGSSGLRLSGGQQLRLALARALYHKSVLLILDDPFSAVDMETEQSIIQNLRSHYRERMIVLISHRLAIFPEVDQVMVIHSDHSVEYGTHASLLNSSALYHSICRLQSGSQANLTAALSLKEAADER